jgi:hypothetical protein
LLVNELPIVVVGAVDAAGIYASYSQGYAHELTVSALGTPHCAAPGGGTITAEGTSFGKPQYNLFPMTSEVDGVI